MKGLADIQVTLYDIFGYLLVGLAAFASLSVFTWALVFPTGALREPHLTSAEWFAVLVVSYILGHLVQGVANALTEHYPSLAPKAREALAWIPCHKKITEKVLLEEPSKDAPDKDKEAHAYKVFGLCEIVVAQKGRAGDREIYQYREGFYRGLAVSFSLGFAAVVIRAVHSGNAVIGNHVQHQHVVTGWEYGLVLFVLAAAIVLAYRRYLLFFKLKWHNTLGAFAVLTDLIPKS
jgi:hypothetical protein